MKRIAFTTGKPFFEIMQWPESELDMWAACFSIDDNNDKPTIKVIEEPISVEDSIANLKRVLTLPH